MADNIRGSNGNWINSYQDETMDMRDRDQDFENASGGIRRVKLGQQVYVPGSGPLRKSEESNGGNRRPEMGCNDPHSMDDSRNILGKGNFGNCIQAPGGVRKPSIPIYQPPRGKKGPMDSNLENIGRRDYSGLGSGPRSIQGDSRESTPSRGDIPHGPSLSTRSLGRLSGRGGRESREQTPSADVNSHDEGSTYGDTARRKAKKPEQARYIPKGRVPTSHDGREQPNGGEASEVEPSSLDSIARDSSPLPPRRDFGGLKHSGDAREPPRSKRNDRGRRRSDVSDHRIDEAIGRGRGTGDGGPIRAEEHQVNRNGDSGNHDSLSVHGNCHDEPQSRDGRRSKRTSGNRGRNFNIVGDGDSHVGDELPVERRNRSPQEERRHIPSLVDLRPIPDPLSNPHMLRNGGRDGGFSFGGDPGDYLRDDDLDDRGSSSHGGRVRAKPPSGRRGSGASVGSLGGQPGGGGGGGGGPSRGRPPSNVDLPPRLRKKLLGMDGGGGGDAEGQAGGGGRRHYDSGGEDWDGSSVTFQWSSSRRRQPANPPQSNSGGLSASRGRGRGRRGRDGDGRIGNEHGGAPPSIVPAQYSRSLTPDRLSETMSSTVCRYPADIMASSMGTGSRRPSWRTPPQSPRSVTPSGEHSRYRRRSGSNPWDGMGADDRRNVYAEPIRHIEPIRPKLMDIDTQPRSLGLPQKDRPFSPIPGSTAPPSEQHNRDPRSKESSLPPVLGKSTAHMDWTVDPDDDEGREDEDDRGNDVTSDSGMASLPRDKRPGGGSVGGQQGRHIVDRNAGDRPEEGRKSARSRRRKKKKGEGRGEDGENTHRSLSRDQGRRDQDRDKGMMRPKSKDRERERERERDRAREKERREREKARAKTREKERERLKERGGREFERNWRDVDRRDMDRREVDRRDMDRRDMDRRDMERRDMERGDMVRRDMDRRDVDRRELERREGDRREIDRRGELDRRDIDHRRDIDRRDIDRRDIDRRDVDRREIDRRDADRREIDRRDIDRREIDRRDLDRRDMDRSEPLKDKLERGRVDRGRNEKERQRDLEREKDCERAGSEPIEGGSRLREEGWEVGHVPQRGGILILPPASTSPNQTPKPPPLQYPSRHPHHMPFRPPMHQEPHGMNDSRIYCPPRVLYDPKDPVHPILVPSGAGRVGGGPMGIHPAMRNAQMGPIPSPMGMVNPIGMGYSGEYMGPPLDQHGSDRPNWYDQYSESFRSAHCPQILIDIERADMELRWILSRGRIMEHWEHVTSLRRHLQLCLQTLLATDLKFCEAENIESHVWKVAFYNIVEPLRKELSAPVPSPTDPTPSDASEDGQRERRERAARNKELIRKNVLAVIDEWTTYLENLLTFLQGAHKFSLDSWLDPSSGHPPPKGLGFLGLALISGQKILIFLGDLARYKEQTNETTNYGKARQWYLKAQLVNPKNGRPYNQLAILAIYARRKLDAVYYYMRSLMASNPFHSARESLIALFDEIRKKFEQTERKRKEEQAAREKERRASREAGDTGDDSLEGGKNRWGLRREVWVRPDAGGRCRVHLSSHRGETNAPNEAEDEERELGHLSSVEVNKRFVTSYLHVQGKLFTKIGMETFQEAGLQMLREFRTLLHHSPLPLNSNRLLQLLALNMFAIENTQLRDRDSECSGGGAEGVYRSAVQESALVVSLQMFNLLLERCVALLRDLCNSSQLETTPLQPPSPTSSSSAPSDSARGTSLATSTSSMSSSVEPTPDPSPQPTPALQLLGGNEDLQTLLPAIKVWCDWLLCHSAVWNPPPSCADYSIGPPGDAWSRLAELVSLLGRLQHGCTEISEVPGEGLEAVRLPEDSSLSGFTPLMANAQEPGYAPSDTDLELAQVCLRIQKLLFFGTEFLCGLDPPVLKLHVVGERGESEYVSVVSSCPSSSAPSPTHALSAQNDQDVLESFSEEDEDEDEESERLAAEKRREEEEAPVRRKTDWADVDSEDEEEIRNLLSRREELKKRHITQEKNRQRVTAILAEQRWAVSGVEVEVRPRLLVPDTNCFIDHLPALRRIISLPSAVSRVPLYTLMVPLIVVSELEGLARGGQRPVHTASSSSAAPSASHSVLVAEGARSALSLLRSPGGGPVPGVRCVTTKGTILPSTTFTVEEDDTGHGGSGEGEMRGNDDRILATCLSLVRAQEGRHDTSSTSRSWRHRGIPAAKHIYREVVLLTEDRNLRVKALARDVPVRGVEWFLSWATRASRNPSRSSLSKCPSPPSQRGLLPTPGPLAT